MGLRSSKGRTGRRWLIWLFEFLIILAIIFTVRGWQQRSLISGAAPEFDEITLQGEPVALADYRGQPVMLHFWASWCGTCEFEQSSISKIAKDWPLVTVAYNSGEAESVKLHGAQGH
ncbi:MAG: redoxin domain-containing protein [Thiolinea sp.]